LIPKMFFLLASEPAGNVLQSEVVGRVFGMEINRVFGLDGNTLTGVIFILINVSILAIVLAKVLYKPVLKFLDDRKERIKAQIKQAEEDKMSANELKAQYEAKIKDIEVERDEILDAARKDAVEKGKQIIDEAKAEAEAIRVRANKNVEMEQERVKDEMRQSIIELSSVMAQKFVERTIDQDLQDKLFTEVMAELNETDFNAASRNLVG